MNVNKELDDLAKLIRKSNKNKRLVDTNEYIICLILEQLTLATTGQLIEIDNFITNTLEGKKNV